MSAKIIDPVTVPQPALLVSMSPSAKCWRLVYNGKTKIVSYLHEYSNELKVRGEDVLFVSSLTDGSPGAVSCADGLQECIDHIKAIGLTLSILPAHVAQALQRQAQIAQSAVRQKAYQEEQEQLRKLNEAKTKPESSQGAEKK